LSLDDFEVVLGIRTKQLHSEGVRKFRSGMIGIARGQVARINVVNTSAVGRVAKSVWCQGWSNPRSELLKESTFTLEPGASAFMDLEWDAVVGQENRHQVRAEVTVLNDADASCVATLEVFDRESGRTAVFMQLSDAPETRERVVPQITAQRPRPEG